MTSEYLLADQLLPGDVIALATRVVRENGAAGRKLAVAESCTGGLVAAALTEVSGSSEIFECGFVTYSDEAKQQLLGVSAEIIATFGAVSATCARAMAQGVLARSNADVAVAVTGIAGPGGGTTQKPVGLVIFAKAEHGNATVIAEERQLAGPTRAAVRHQATLVALALLLP